MALLCRLSMSHKSCVAEKTVEIHTVGCVEKIVETPEIKTGRGIQEQNRCSGHTDRLFQFSCL